MSAAALNTGNLEQALVDAIGWVRRGWTQGAYCRNKAGTAVMPDHNGVQRVDIAWALGRAARDRGVPEDELRSRVQEQLPARYRNDRLFGIERWNDVEGRTRTEVIIVLERTLQNVTA